MACIDVEKFQLINDRYDTDTGDKVLRHIAASIGVFEDHTWICCRYMADKFAIMYPAKLIGTDKFVESHRSAHRRRDAGALAQNLDVMALIHPDDLPGIMEKVSQLKKDRQPRYAPDERLADEHTRL